ncbi:MAG TPA: FmdB family zinc ribbon protein [Steroidobacteraceae bacterium]|nr:FmdB family zinc ribbon protein [Steroidobacteraceae bacterium]
MPFYEYECSSCKFYTEVMQKITDAPLRKCPSCGKNTLQKLVSAPVFRLKGGGWYETDFKSDKESRRNLAGAEASEAKADSDAKPAAAKSTEAKPAESKPADSKPAQSKPSPAASRARRTASGKSKPRPGRARKARR